MFKIITEISLLLNNINYENSIVFLFYGLAKKIVLCMLDGMKGIWFLLT